MRAISVLFCLLLSTTAGAAPIFSSFDERGGSLVGTELSADVTFWSLEPFLVRAFHAETVRPGIVLEGEFFPFERRELPIGAQVVHVATALRSALPTCGTLQLDAFRGDWLDLTYGYWQFADDCTQAPPPCLTCQPPPPPAPEPPIWLLAAVFWAVALWRTRHV